MSRRWDPWRVGCFLLCALFTITAWLLIIGCIAALVG